MHNILFVIARPRHVSRSRMKRGTNRVQARHKLTVIAKQYGVDINQLYEWNAWPKSRVLQVGDAVVIYKKKP